MEAETAKYALERLVEIGYPKELRETNYLSDFAVRGLIFDKKLGNFLKLDLHGLVLTACRGSRKFSRFVVVWRHDDLIINVLSVDQR